jgi:hypothetical protein
MIGGSPPGRHRARTNALTPRAGLLPSPQRDRVRASGRH